MEFKRKNSEYVDLVNQTLAGYIHEKDTPEGTIYKAMRYSLMAGGKRLRPVLMLAVNEMLMGDIKDVMPFACALEMIHTYSLIHDDLPAMDNDDFRRGMPTNHKVFGEAMAILAGDALLTYAFQVVSEELKRSVQAGAHLEGKVKAMAYMAEAAGTTGMVGGQVVDLESEGKQISAELLKHMHRLKTGALIKAAVLIPAIVLGAGEADMNALELFAERLGLAFQIKDDILDVEGSLESMGKPQGSDVSNAKSTYVTLFGMDQAKEMLASSTEEAISAIGHFEGRAEFLIALSRHLVGRQN